MLQLTPKPAPSLRKRLLIASTIAAGSLMALALFLMIVSAPTAISGVVNDYQVATHVADKSIVLEDVSAFQAGDKLIIMQMKGATISTRDDATYGDIVDFGEAGSYEFAQVRALSGDTLQLTLSLCRAYDPDHLVQVIRVPVYEEAEVVGTLTATPWDGQKGGVVAIEATERIRLQASIDVREMGFRGGDRNGQATTGGLTYICNFHSGQGGIKGEGIVELPWAACRGKLANGGGGANDHNGGGGGGSGYGAGGQGGHGWKSHNLSDTDKGGRGGLSLQPYYDAGLPKLFLGGGGGGGHQNNGASYPAGNGGGIVILIAPELELQSQQNIFASGADAQDHTINDGASGGGGGGSILLDVHAITEPQWLTLDVSGGDGATLTTAQQHGPGGGGGGGLINATVALPAAVKTVLHGGTSGLFVSTTGNNNPYHRTPHGAQDGQPGAVVNNLFLPVCSAPPSLDLNGNQPGTDYARSYLPGAPPALITDSSLNDIQDLDDVEMQQMTIRLSNPLDSTYEAISLALDASQIAAMGLSCHLGANGHQITINGAGLLPDYLAILGKLCYQNTAPNLNRSQRAVQITVDDGGAVSNLAQAFVSFESGVFPVEWLGVEVVARGEDALLRWATAQEQNNHFFEVERSADGSLFQPIGRVEGQGTTSEVSQYEFLDTEAARQGVDRLVYRLRQVDLDGAFSYSSLLEFELGDFVPELKVGLFPNPASGQVKVRIQGAAARTLTLSLLNLNGQLMRQLEQRLPNGQGELTFDLSGIPAGTYLVQVRNGNQQQSVKLSVR